MELLQMVGVGQAGGLVAQGVGAGVRDRQLPHGRPGLSQAATESALVLAVEAAIVPLAGGASRSSSWPTSESCRRWLPAAPGSTNSGDGN